MEIDIIDEMANVMGDVARMGIGSFKKGLQEKNLVLTEALLNSFRSDLAKQGFEVSVEFFFLDYFRYKDRKVLDYSNKLPNPEALEAYVNEEGVEKFARMFPKVFKSKVPTASILAKKIALNIMFSRRKTPIVRRRFDGTVYNTKKMRIINSASYLLRTRVASTLAEVFAREIEKED